MCSPLFVYTQNPNFLIKIEQDFSLQHIKICVYWKLLMLIFINTLYPPFKMKELMDAGSNIEQLPSLGGGEPFA